MLFASPFSTTRLSKARSSSRREPLRESSNKRMKLTSVLASAPRDTEEGHSACSPFGEHRTLAAYPGCYADIRGTPANGGIRGRHAFLERPCSSQLVDQLHQLGSTLHDGPRSSAHGEPPHSEHTAG